MRKRKGEKGEQKWSKNKEKWDEIKLTKSMGDTTIKVRKR